MTNLGKKNDIFVVRFRFAVKEFKISLKVRNLREAEAAKRLVELTIHRLITGQLSLPPNLDPGEFILSGGKLVQPIKTKRKQQSIEGAIRDYLEAQKTYLAQSTHKFFGYHLNHWLRHLGGTEHQSVATVTRNELESYLRKRVAAPSETTAAKERRTLIHFFKWAVAQDYLDDSPASTLTPLKAEGERPPYRTLTEVQSIIERGGMTDEEELDLWECIFLQPDEIAELLGLVEQRSIRRESFLLHAIPAYIGMRRGEVLRLTWPDIDQEGGFVRARSLKQSRRRRETVRTIDLHPELQKILVDWQKSHPRGQLVLPDPERDEVMNSSRANCFFRSPLRKTSWCLDGRKGWFKIGFHTYRHSFASNLAARRVGQRIIDEFVGHSTEAMRRRYRHLFPASKKAAIASFSLRLPEEGSDA